jgi:exodeoxyribonuclease V gamma subunit
VVTELVDRSAGLRAGAPRHLDVTVELPSGIRVVGTVPGVYGDCLVRVVYSRLGPKHRLRAWVQLLALAAAQPDHEWEAKTVGRGSKKGTVALSHLSGVGPEDARSHLASLVELYAAGMCRPLPLPAKASCAYAEKRREDAPVSVAVAHAGKQWRTGSGTDEQGEFTDADHRQVWGDVALSALLAEPADPTDPAWPQEPHRFGQLARRLWTPLLDAETVHQ